MKMIMVILGMFVMSSSFAETPSLVCTDDLGTYLVFHNLDVKGEKPYVYVAAEAQILSVYETSNLKVPKTRRSATFTTASSLAPGRFLDMSLSLKKKTLKIFSRTTKMTFELICQ